MNIFAPRFTSNGPTQLHVHASVLYDAGHFAGQVERERRILQIQGNIKYVFNWNKYNKYKLENL